MYIFLYLYIHVCICTDKTIISHSSSPVSMFGYCEAQYCWPSCTPSSHPLTFRCHTSSVTRASSHMPLTHKHSGRQRRWQTVSLRRVSHLDFCHFFFSSPSPSASL